MLHAFSSGDYIPSFKFCLNDVIFLFRYQLSSWKEQGGIVTRIGMVMRDTELGQELQAKLKLNFGPRPTTKKLKVCGKCACVLFNHATLAIICS